VNRCIGEAPSPPSFAAQVQHTFELLTSLEVAARLHVIGWFGVCAQSAARLRPRPIHRWRRRCQNNKRSGVPSATSVKARRRVLRPANSFARKYITFERASTERDRPSRQSPSGSRRPAVPESSYRAHQPAQRQRRSGAPNTPVARRSDARSRQPDVLRRPSEPSVAKADAPRRIRRSHDRQKPRQNDAPQPLGGPQQRRPCGPRDRESDVRPRARRRGCAQAIKPERDALDGPTCSRCHDR
jgi:hypothetical protein